VLDHPHVGQNLQGTIRAGAADSFITSAGRSGLAIAGGFKPRNTVRPVHEDKAAGRYYINGPESRAGSSATPGPKNCQHLDVVLFFRSAHVRR